MIQIIITIKDEETLEDYKDVCEEIIIDDFISNSESWFSIMSKIQVIKED